MKQYGKNIVSAAVIAAIILAVWYLESNKPAVGNGSSQDIVVSEATGTPAVSDSSKKEAAPAMKTKDRGATRQLKAASYPRAKEFSDIQGFINAAPFKLADLVGKKVILLDFWTYSCINCLRTLPYLISWNEKYKDSGLVIIGIHTPEFDFEKNYGNVEKAVKNLGVTYPVALDSNYGTWNAYQNQYWPREYLIDIDGFIVHDHAGEGAYDETEAAIKKALAERSDALGLSAKIYTGGARPVGVIPIAPSQVGSPETYFGSGRNEYLGNGVRGISGTQSLALPANIKPNQLYLDGEWDFQGEFAKSASVAAKIIYKYNAKNVYFVASSENGVKIKVFRDGVLLSGTEAGRDIGQDGTVFIKDNRLYDLIDGSDYGEHTLEIEAEGSGLQAFTFTFG